MMTKFKVHAFQHIALEFEITAADAEAADAAVSYLLDMSKVVFVPMEPKIAPRFVRFLERRWRLEITRKESIH
jgi:hypothetical protein